MRASICALAVASAMGTVASSGAQAPEPQDGFGGRSDIGLTRHQAASGYVPTAESYSVEGLLAENHFPARTERCETRFCVLTAMGHGAHRVTGERSAWMVVEPVSGFSPESLQRPALDLAIVIDRSGSMNGWKIAAALEAAHVLVGKLDARDRIAIVSFDDTPRVDLASRAVRDPAAIHAAIDGIQAGGSTNLHGGLSLGFDQLAEPGPRARRVILLTDELPNVGPTGTDSFRELVGAHANRGTGLSVIGVGLDMGPQLADAMSQFAGGAYHYLLGAEQAAELFADLRRFVVPVATNLAVTIRPGRGLRVGEVYGVPESNVVIRADGSATLRASTVFFDPVRRGAVVRLDPVMHRDRRAALSATATLSWSYTLPETGRRATGEGSTEHEGRADAIADFPSPSAYRAYALVGFGELLRTALGEWHQGERSRALGRMLTARAMLDLDRAVLLDPQLADERRLADDVLRAMGALGDKPRVGAR